MRTRYACFSSQLTNAVRTLCEGCADVIHPRLCQFRARVALTSWDITSPFRNPIRYIVGVGSEKQVSGVATGRIIAMVQYLHTLWYRAIGDSPRNAMGTIALTLPRRSSVAFRNSRTLPLPTITRSVNAIPEAFGGGSTHTSAGTIGRLLTWAACKYLATYRAGSLSRLVSGTCYTGHCQFLSLEGLIAPEDVDASLRLSCAYYSTYRGMM